MSVQSIEEAFAAIPSQTCTRRSGTITSGQPSHVETCERCARIRAFGLAVLAEATPDHTGHGAPQCEPCLDTIALLARIEALAPAQEG